MTNQNHNLAHPLSRPCGPLRTSAHSDSKVFVYTVDEYTDRITKRLASVAALKIAENARQWGGKIELYAGIFDEESDAVKFILNRAANRISVAEVKLAVAKLKLKRLQKKFERPSGTGSK